MKNKSIYILLLLTYFLSSKKIDAQDDPLKFGKLRQQDIYLPSSAIDTTAAAVILYDFGKIYFDTFLDELRLFYEKHIRIKILKPEGLKYAQVEIPYFGREKYDYLLDIKACSYNMNEKGEWKTTKLDYKRIKDSTFTNGWRKAYFTITNVQVGSIIEFYYLMPSLDFLKPTEWHFQNEIPTVCSDFTINSPEYFSYAILLDGEQYLTKREEKESYFHFYWTFTPSATNLGYRGIAYDYRRRQTLNWRGTMHHLVMENLPAFQKNENEFYKFGCLASAKSHLMQVMRPSGQMQVSDVSLQQFTKPLLLSLTEDYFNNSRNEINLGFYPSGYTIYSLPDWDKQNEKLLKDSRFGKLFQKFWQHHQIILKTIGESDDKLQNMIALYDYVRSNLKWNGKYSIYADNDFKTIYEKKSGSVAEINLLLTSLMENAGLKANPVILSTRQNGEIQKKFPALDLLNYVVCEVELDGTTYFLDATNPKFPYNFINKDIAGIEGWVVKKQDAGWVQIPEMTNNKSNTLIELNLIDSSTVSGKIEIRDVGYYAIKKNGLKDNVLDSLIKLQLSKNIKSFKIDSITNFFDNSNSTFISKINFKLITKQLKFDSIILIPEFLPTQLPILQTDNMQYCTLLFDYPVEEDLVMNIKISENYKFANLPASKKYENQTIKSSLILMTNSTQNTCQYKSSLKILQTNFRSNDLLTINQFIAIVNQSRTLPVVIKKNK